MKKIKILAVILLSGLFSCEKHNSVSTIDVLKQFSKTIELSQPEVLISDLLDPAGIIKLDSLLVISEPMNDPMLTMYSISGKHIANFLRKGRGPGETSNLLFATSYTDSTFQVTVDPESVFLYKMKDVLSGKTLPYCEFNLPIGKYAFSTILKYNDDDYLYIGKDSEKHDNNDNRFCVYHADSKTIDSFGVYPEKDESIVEFPTEDYSKLNAYQGRPVLKPDHSKSVISYYYAVGFDIIDLKTLHIEKSLFYQYPQVEVSYIPELKINAIKRDLNSLRGFLDVWCNDDSIYFLYSGKFFSNSDHSAGKYILKYNWDGEPLCIYQLDQEISCFTLDKGETTIYAGLSEGMSACIICYSLK